MEQALARWGSRVGEGAEEETAPLLDYAAVAFGYRYQSAAVLGAPEDARPAYCRCRADRAAGHAGAARLAGSAMGSGSRRSTSSVATTSS